MPHLGEGLAGLEGTRDGERERTGVSGAKVDGDDNVGEGGRGAVHDVCFMSREEDLQRDGCFGGHVREC